MTRSQKFSFIALFLIVIIGFAICFLFFKDIRDRQIITTDKVISIDNYCKE